MAWTLRRCISGVVLVTLSVCVGLSANVMAGPAHRGGQATRAAITDKFIGSWRLKSAITRDEAGNTHPIFEFGKLTYTAQGDVWTLVGSSGQPLQVAYTGTFDVRPRTHTVIHHLEYSATPGQNGTDLTRRYHFRGDSLRLTAELRPGTSLILWWKRV